MTFQWQEEKGAQHNLIHRIVHVPAGSFLAIDYVVSAVDAGYRFDCWPNTVELEWGASKWENLRQNIFRWLQAVKVESDSPDLWALAEQERAWLTSGSAGSDASSPFSAIEIEQNTVHLRTIEEFAIKTYNLEAEHRAQLQEQIR